MLRIELLLFAQKRKMTFDLYVRAKCTVGFEVHNLWIFFYKLNQRQFYSIYLSKFKLQKIKRLFKKVSLLKPSMQIYLNVDYNGSFTFIHKKVGYGFELHLYL